jgi:triosephosphate isomerase
MGELRELTTIQEWYYQVHQRHLGELEQRKARPQDWWVPLPHRSCPESSSPKSNSLTTTPEVVVAPPSLYLIPAREQLRKGLEVAAQNIFDKPSGAFTGEISAEQLKDSGITWTLIGHSERRVILQEDDAFVASKTKAALDSGISVILCCGESLEQREAGKTIEVVTSQLKAVADKVKDWSKIVVAYEPIWYVSTNILILTRKWKKIC